MLHFPSALNFLSTYSSLINPTELKATSIKNINSDSVYLTSSSSSLTESDQRSAELKQSIQLDQSNKQICSQSLINDFNLHTFIQAQQQFLHNSSSQNINSTRSNSNMNGLNSVTEWNHQSTMDMATQLAHQLLILTRSKLSFNHSINSHQSFDQNINTTSNHLLTNTNNYNYNYTNMEHKSSNIYDTNQKSSSSTTPPTNSTISSSSTESFMTDLLKMECVSTPKLSPVDEKWQNLDYLLNLQQNSPFGKFHLTNDGLNGCTSGSSVISNQTVQFSPLQSSHEESKLFC